MNNEVDRNDSGEDRWIRIYAAIVSKIELCRIQRQRRHKLAEHWKDNI